MSNLSKWNPFKFNRNRNDQNERESSAIAPGDTYDPFARMERQMSQLMRSFFDDDPFGSALRTTTGSNSFFGDFAPKTFVPTIDVTNEANYLVVSAEIPGLQKNDVELTVDDNTMTIRGTKRHDREGDEEGVYRTERYFGSFQRTIPLPGDVDTNGAEAQFDSGVLTVKFPRKELESTGPRRIELS